MAFNFTMPKRTVVGTGALMESGEIIKKMGKRAFIITGKVVVKTEAFKKLSDMLESFGISYVIFDGITGEPTDEMINESVAKYKEEACDFCIAIGGGSPLDSAKATVAMVTLGGEISDYMGKNIEGIFPPLVLIPTTAGTGSETTKFTVITDSKKDIKMLLKGDDLLPQLAIIDPEFTMTAPKSITAATGMDALTHAIESYTSRKANALTDTYALSAIKRIFKYLPSAYNDGNDAKAREEMAIAAFEAGICINNASVTLVHGMSRPIGALFHVSHGISNAMLIKECLKFALEGCSEKFANIAKAIGAVDEKADEQTALDGFINALDDICNKCDIPSLEKYGIDKEEFFKVIDKMAGDAIASGSPANTVKEVTKEDVIEIYKKLW